MASAMHWSDFGGKMITQYAGNIFGPVEVGHIFVIAGKTLDAPTRFNVNLAGGKSGEADLPLHLSVRFHSESIVRNSLLGGEWGHEENEENLAGFGASNPIVPGWDFNFYIFVGDDRFHVAINNREYCTYHFRTSLDEIHAITVNGDVQSLTQIDHRQSYPSPWPLIQHVEKRVAFSSDVPRLFSPGHVIIITAIPFGNPNGQFTLQFTEGATKKQAYHFQARFQPRIVAVNSMTDSLE